MRSYEATGRGFADGVHKHASENLVLVIQEMLVSLFVQEADKCFLGGGSCVEARKARALWQCPTAGKRFFILQQLLPWRSSGYLRSGFLLSRCDVEGVSI